MYSGDIEHIKISKVINKRADSGCKIGRTNKQSQNDINSYKGLILCVFHFPSKSIKYWILGG